MLKLSVGIAAYKSENNVVRLVNSLLTQNHASFEFLEIVVHCDGNEDATARIVGEKFAQTTVPVRLIQTLPRQGYAYAMRRLFEEGVGDVVVTLNDDILIEDADFLTKIAAPFQADARVGMVTARPVPVSTGTFMDRALESTDKAYAAARYAIKAGNTAHTVDGKVMAFSRAFISAFSFPDELGIMGNVDCFLYFSVVTKGFTYIHVKDAVIYSRRPNTVTDFIKFNTRCNASMAIMKRSFDAGLVAAEYVMPTAMARKGLLTELLKNPFGVITVHILDRYSRWKARYEVRNFNSTWDLVETTKKLG